MQVMLWRPETWADPAERSTFGDIFYRLKQLLLAPSFNSDGDAAITEEMGAPGVSWNELPHAGKFQNSRIDIIYIILMGHLSGECVQNGHLTAWSRSSLG